MQTLTSQQIAKRIQFHKPCNGFLTQGFGPKNTVKRLLPKYKKWGFDGHAGHDFGAKTGTPAFSVMEIETVDIRHENQDKGYGNHIWCHSKPIPFQQGAWQGEFILEFVYGHFDKHVPGLKKRTYDSKGKIKSRGTIFKPGDICGYIGSTGFSTGPHLHFAVRPYYKIDGVWIADMNNGMRGYVDPSPMFDGYPLDLDRIYRQYDGRMIKSPDSAKVYLLLNKTKRWFPNELYVWSHGYSLWSKESGREIVKLSPQELNEIPEGTSMEKGQYWEYLTEMLPELTNYVKQ